jgi:hypothetical protein
MGLLLGMLLPPGDHCILQEWFAVTSLWVPDDCGTTLLVCDTTSAACSGLVCRTARSPYDVPRPTCVYVL